MGILGDMFGGGSKKGKNRKGASLSQGRKAKKVNVHGDGKANQNRSGGKARGSGGAR